MLGGMLTGSMIIGGESVVGDGELFYGVDPSSAQELAPGYRKGSLAHVDMACRLAAEALPIYQALSCSERAELLRDIAGSLETIEDEIVQRAQLETSLGIARLTGEFQRTVNQIRLFTNLLENGDWMGIRYDSAMPDRNPSPRPQILQSRIPLGPVAVFGASNFPLAFSVAGGDTVSALAAGCPVIVKAHEAHPGTSELVGSCIAATVRSLGLPSGVFSLLYGDGPTVGGGLVKDPRVKAVGFTGSRSAGLSLAESVSARKVPIPIYAEMSSVNPIFILPNKLDSSWEEIANSYVESLTLGSGQFCTNPGLMFVARRACLEKFLNFVAESISGLHSFVMLNKRIADRYRSDLAALSKIPGANLLAGGIGSSPAVNESSESRVPASLIVVNAASFVDSEIFQREIFGPSSIIVVCDDFDQMMRAAESLEGQLTASVHADLSEYDNASRLIVILQGLVGRLIFNGWPTGVEVCHAMVHGGPFPSTYDGRTTSVGTLAIERFLRPISFQGFPDSLLPLSVTDVAARNSLKLVDGHYKRGSL